MRFYCSCLFRLLNSRTIDIFVSTDSHQSIVYKIVFYMFKGALNHTTINSFSAGPYKRRTCTVYGTVYDFADFNLL
jgi:hypothetical protein